MMKHNVCFSKSVDVDIEYTLEDIIFFIENAGIEELTRIIEISTILLKEEKARKLEEVQE